jgi:hypothetical protein
MRSWLGTVTAGQKGQTRGPTSPREVDLRQETKDTDSCFFTDLCQLNGDRPRGVPSKEYKERERARDRKVFDDKYLELLKQNGWGGGGKKLPNTWADREEAYNDLMQIMGTKVQCQLLPRRAGDADESQAEPGCVQDERVQNENPDDGVSPDKEMGEAGGGGGGNGIEQCDGDGKVCVGGGGMEMTTVWTTMSTTTRFWRRTGRDRRRRRRRSKMIRFRRTMLKSLICFISSTGA